MKDNKLYNFHFEGKRCSDLLVRDEIINQR